MHTTKPITISLPADILRKTEPIANEDVRTGIDVTYPNVQSDLPLVQFRFSRIIESGKGLSNGGRSAILIE